MNVLHLTNQLCFPFYSISKEITKRFRLLLEPLHLPYPQYLVMLVLWEQDQIPMKAIRTRLQLDSRTLTPLINKLITLGYIEDLYIWRGVRRNVLGIFLLIYTFDS